MNVLLSQTRLVPLVHHMGGSIRKDMTAKVTHLIANITSGDKYQYATTFRVPVMNMHWVHSSWEKRHDISFSATLDTFVVSIFMFINQYWIQKSGSCIEHTPF